MKKAISLIAISVLTASLLFGCKAKTVDNPNNDANQSSTAQNGQNQGNFNGRGQFQRADLSGQVVSIKGNSVTIKVIKQPEFTQQNGNNNNGSSNGNGNNSSSNNNNNNNNNNSNNGNNFNGNGNNQGQRPRRQLEFTGETKTITIPDGTSITTMVRGNQGRQTEQLKVTDLKADDILQIYYADKTKGTISKISVQEYSINGNGGNGNNNNSNSNNNNNNSNSSNQSSST